MTYERLLAGDVTDALIVERRDSAGWIRFNDPARHNAMSLQMWADLPRALQALEEDPRVRCVVLTGVGDKAFVSGANIAQFDAMRTAENDVREYEVAAEAAQVALFEYAKPTLARIRGYCIGGGLNLALCCDLRLASDDSIFAVPAGRLGLGYRLSAMRNLVHTVGVANALEIFLTAARYDAAKAASLGLVHQVCATGDLDGAVQHRIEQISANAPLTLRAGKRMIRELQKLRTEMDTQAMQALVMQCFSSSDYQEGKRAFAEKRPPRFRGE